MKILKTTTLSILATLSLSVTGADKTDEVVSQINISRDAVTVAREALFTGAMNDASLDSLDSQEKHLRFLDKTSKILDAYNKGMEEKVLFPLSTMINQYREMEKTQTFDGPTKAHILDGIAENINSSIRNLSNAYTKEYMTIYNVFPVLPFYLEARDYCKKSFFGDYCAEWTSKERGSHSIIRTLEWKLTYLDGTTKNYFFTVNSDKSNRLLNGEDYARPKGNYYDMLARVFNDQAPRDILFQDLLKDCFTSTCYFTSVRDYQLWQVMAKTNLAKPIKILIGKSDGILGVQNSMPNMIESVLAALKPEDFILNLPTTISSERLSLLKKITKLVTDDFSRDCKTKSTPLKEKLCHETPEGCLTDIEVELLAYKAKLSGNSNALGCLN